jgi:hypothetical protein
MNENKKWYLKALIKFINILFLHSHHILHIPQKDSVVNLDISPAVQIGGKASLYVYPLYFA